MVTPWMAGRKMTLNVAIEMAQAFKASVTASAIKLVKRSEAPACVVCHSIHGRRWFVRSLSWPFDFYPRKDLHQDTAAFSLALKATSSMSTPRKEQADHWVTGPELWGKSVESQSMKLPDDTVLTMLALAPARPGR